MLVVHDVAITKQILRQEDVRRWVSGVRQPPQVPAQRYPASCLAALHCIAELGILTPAFHGPAADIKPGSDLFVRGLHGAELLEFIEVNFHPRTCHGSLPTL